MILTQGLSCDVTTLPYSHDRREFSVNHGQDGEVVNHILCMVARVSDGLKNQATKQ